MEGPYAEMSKGRVDVLVASWMTEERQMGESRITPISVVCRAEKMGGPVTKLGHISRRATTALELCLGHIELKSPEGHSN